eukprot:3941967-Rhodomonas_salina.6
MLRNLRECLRPCYALCGTIYTLATRRPVQPVCMVRNVPTTTCLLRHLQYCLRPTAHACATRCAVLRWRMRYQIFKDAVSDDRMRHLCYQVPYQPALAPLCPVLRADVASEAIVLRACYAVSGTDMAYAMQGPVQGSQEQLQHPVPSYPLLMPSPVL